MTPCLRVPIMSNRFVILEHAVKGETHYDLMLEVEGQDKLRTYQLASWPLVVGESCVCRRLEDHRGAYLEYEGEVSGNRGVVRRVESGTWSGELELTMEVGSSVSLKFREEIVTRVD